MLNLHNDPQKQNIESAFHNHWPVQFEVAICEFKFQITTMMENESWLMKTKLETNDPAESVPIKGVLRLFANGSVTGPLQDEMVIILIFRLKLRP